MKKYILSLLGIFVAMAFIASCQQEGTTVTEEPDNAPPANIGVLVRFDHAASVIVNADHSIV